MEFPLSCSEHSETEADKECPDVGKETDESRGLSQAECVTESTLTHLGDLDGLCVEDVAKRIVADTLSRAIQKHYVTTEPNMVCWGL